MLAPPRSLSGLRPQSFQLLGNHSYKRPVFVLFLFVFVCVFFVVVVAVGLQEAVVVVVNTSGLSNTEASQLQPLKVARFLSGPFQGFRCVSPEGSP